MWFGMKKKKLSRKNHIILTLALKYFLNTIFETRAMYTHTHESRLTKSGRSADYYYTYNNKPSFPRCLGVYIICRKKS